MNWQENDDHDNRGDDPGPWRSRRSKYRSFEEDARAAAHRDKRSGKRAHRQHSFKDNFWSDHDR